MSSNAALANIPLPDVSLEQLDGDREPLTRLLVGIRRHLHRHPELGMREHATAQFIRQTLEHYGLEVQGPVAQTGLFVDIGDPEMGSHVGYRADIDALPSQDVKTTDYRSRHPGVAHLCGHDAHTAVGIAVALLLKAREPELPGAVRVFFQPNEEGMPSGAPLMIRDGVIDQLDALYAIHVDPQLSTGRYGLITGPITAACDRFDVFVRQEGSGHSARPHEGVDTVWVAHQIVQSLYQLAGRVTDARNATVLTICRFQGGEAHNVIPAQVSFGGTLRTTSSEDRLYLREMIRETAYRQGELYGAQVAVDFDTGAPPVINASELISNVKKNVIRLFGEEAVYHIPRASMGGEDFAHYLKHVPGALIRVGTSSSPETSYPLHDARFDIDEAALPPTARLMKEVLISYLSR